MRKILLLVMCLMAANAVFSQIKYTNINPDSVFNIKVAGTYSEDSAVYLDIDGDAQNDFYFKNQYISGFAGITWKLQMHCSNPINQAYWKSTSTSFFNHFIKGLKLGDSITPNVLFGSDRDPLLGDHTASNIIGTGDTYIGVKFVSGVNIYYGWILLSALYSGGSSGNITVKSYAYNSTPNEKINAGDSCIKTTSTTKLSDCDSVTWNGKTYNNSGTYTYNTTNSVGCDSIATLIFTKNTSTKNINITACDSFELNSMVYYTTGLYTQVLSKANAKGCDSTIKLDLTIKKSTYNTITTTACDSFSLNGTTYYSTGSYTQTLTNTEGCDSVINLNLTINTPSASSMIVTACDTFELNGIKYVTTGNYTQTIKNTAGCDSVISLKLTINKSTSATMMTSSCDSFKLNDSVYYQTGTYTQKITNSKGCDSTIILHLIINHSSTNTINANACDSFTLNGTTYTSSGTYTQILTNIHGCDSIITLVLTTQTVNTGVVQNHNTLTAAATGLNYQWLNCNNNYSLINGATLASFTPTVNGDYAVEIIDGACKDTSICHTVTLLGIDNNFANNVSVYPNPTNGNILLNLGATYTDVTISVSNILGELISKESHNAAKEVFVNINTASGIYFIIINTPQYSTRVKVIKQ